MKYQKSVFIPIVVFLSLLFMAAPLFAQEKEIKIGVLYPLSGAAATIGRDLQRAAELTADIINHSCPKYFYWDDPIR